MGTKEKPGKFDCYANAKPDEPMFILLGRDRDAPDLVEAWAKAREERGEDHAKVEEARECAAAMREYRAKSDKVRSLFERGLTMQYGVPLNVAIKVVSILKGDEDACVRVFDFAAEKSVDPISVAEVVAGRRVK